MKKQKIKSTQMKTNFNTIKFSLGLGLLVLLASCSSTIDKKAELDKLKKQHDQIADQILKLETELKLNDTTAIKYSDVMVTEVKPSEFNHYIEVQGKLDGEENTTVFPANQGGTVIAVFVKEGDNVKKGQVLAQLDNSIILKNIEAAQVNADMANTVYEKYKALWEKKIGSEVQFLQAKSTKEYTEKYVQSLTGQLDLCKVTAPINGTIEEVNIKVGQFASPQSPQPLFRVVNFSSVKILADIAEVYASKVKPGNKVKVFFPDFNEEFESKILFSSKYINPTNRSFQVETRLGPSGKVDFKANMMAVVKINDYSNPKALILPVNLVKDSQNGKIIWLSEVEGGKTVAHKRNITVGQTYNGLVEITSGLKEGEKVISTGFNSLIDGQLISIK
jgi:membrane fusion protein, multidrug efflux system